MKRAPRIDPERRFVSPAVLVGVVGTSDSDDCVEVDKAYLLGRLIAAMGWVLLNGGRRTGVMDASARGAKEAGGLTVGLLPDADASQASEFVDVRIVTGLQSARNNLIALSSHLVFACEGGPGTLSEIALALKSGRPVILVGCTLPTEFGRWFDGTVVAVPGPEEAIEAAKRLLPGRG